MPSKEELEKMKVTELKQLCKDKGLPQSGNKADLVVRLIAAEQKPAEEAEKAEPAVEEDKEAKPEEADTSKATPEEPPKAESEEAEKKEAEPSETPAAPEPEKAQEVKDEKTKMLDRAKRFGMAAPELEEAKKIDRAKRFGLAVPQLEEEKRQSRAKRFNTVLESDKILEGKMASDAKGDVKTDEDRKLERAKRFGMPVPELEADKMKQRAERFATNTRTFALEQGTPATDHEAKKKLRSERFGAGGAATETARPAAAAMPEAEDRRKAIAEEEERKKKRAARFALPAAEAAEPEADKKKQRLERFGVTAVGSEDEKKKLRAERFGTKA